MNYLFIPQARYWEEECRYCQNTGKLLDDSMVSHMDSIERARRNLGTYNYCHCPIGRDLKFKHALSS